MTTLGAVHLGIACLAIASGAAVILTAPKGGRVHKRLGWTYVVTMLLTNATALMIYRLFGGFGPFHFLALISLVSVFFGTAFAVKARNARRQRDLVRRERMIQAHYRTIVYSYLGLLAAFASEVIVRLPVFRESLGPGPVFGFAVLGASLAVMWIGSRMIRSNAERVLAPFRAAR